MAPQSVPDLMTTRPAPVDVIDHIARTGVVPVLTVHHSMDAEPLIRALMSGGLTAVEITLRTEEGLAAIERAAALDGGCIVGAGSVRSVAEAEAAIDAGADFLVSPGLDDQVVQVAAQRSIAAIPGVATASEVMRARQLGLDVLKLFPAEAIGGIHTLGALAAVFPDVRFMPTGGISPSNAAEYLALDAVLAVGGSWMVPSQAIVERDWTSITSAAAAAVALRQGVR